MDFRTGLIITTVILTICHHLYPPPMTPTHTHTHTQSKEEGICKSRLAVFHELYWTGCHATPYLQNQEHFPFMLLFLTSQSW